MAPLACQRLEVLLGGVRRLEAEFLGDFRPGRRKAVVFQAALDEGEDLGLAGRQLLHVVALCFYPVTGIIYSERGVAMIFRMTFRPASR